MPTLTNQFLIEELEMLQREKGKPCVSIIAPLWDLSAGRKTDKLYLQKVIKAAIDEIKLTYPGEAASLVESINNLHNEIDFDRAREGVGIFVSSDFKYQTFFPFSVKEKIVVDNSFEIRDVLFKAHYHDQSFLHAHNPHKKNFGRMPDTHVR